MNEEIRKVNKKLLIKKQLLKNNILSKVSYLSADLYKKNYFDCI